MSSVKIQAITFLAFIIIIVLIVGSLILKDKLPDFACDSANNDQFEEAAQKFEFTVSARESDSNHIRSIATKDRCKVIFDVFLNASAIADFEEYEHDAISYTATISREDSDIVEHITKFEDNTFFHSIYPIDEACAQNIDDLAVYLSYDSNHLRSPVSDMIHRKFFRMSH